MTVEYTRRAATDLATIAVDSRAAFGDAVAAALERRFREIIDQIEWDADSATPVSARPGVHVVALVKYPFKLFYRVISPEQVRIVHIRSTSRRQWKGERA
jgi:plasmid stabilization system protein ParE